MHPFAPSLNYRLIVLTVWLLDKNSRIALQAEREFFIVTGD